MKFSKTLLLIGALATSVAVLVVLRSGSKHKESQKADSLPRVATGAPAISGNISSPPQPTSTATPVATGPASLAVTLGQFGAWAEKFKKAATEQERGSLIPQGEALAKARREELKKLMQTDPALALRQLVPYSLRKRLPESVKPYLEEPVSGRGKLSLIESTPLPGYEAPEAWYKAEFNRKIYHAHLAGRKPAKTVNGITLVGAAIDDVLALNSVPPVLEDAQVADLIQQGKIATESVCSVSGQTVQNPVVVDLGGTYRTFCTARHAQEFQRQYDIAATALDASSVAEVAVAASLSSSNLPPSVFGTQGRHRLLVIPVAYADDPRPPVSQDGITAGVLANNQYYEEGSYSTVSFVSTVTPLLTLPQRKLYYAEFLDTALWSDAVTVAEAQGYFSSDYDHIYVVFNSLPGVSFGGRSDGLLQANIGAISHELGHNFGLNHANWWNVDKAGPPGNPNNYPFDRDSDIGHYDVNAPFRFGSKDIPIQEYGNPFDVMGSGGGHFSASAKNHMNWLPDKFTRVIPTWTPTSETNRIYAFDTPHISPGRIYAVRVRKNAHESFPETDSAGMLLGGRNYWATYRQGFPNNPWVSTGIQLNWDANGFSRNTLIDTTPDSAAGKDDSAVTIGRTFADPEIPFYLTPTAQGGGPDPSDKWIDVVVNIGPFPANLPPVLSLSASALTVAPGDTVDFTADATDPNGDVLAYNWDFGDGSFGFNLPANSKTFSASGTYVVRCEVSDMKGGKDSAYVVVKVGIPTDFSVSGRVIDINGNPLQGVRVHNGGTPVTNSPPAPIGYPAGPPPTNGGTYRFTYTDSQGNFTMSNVPRGTNQLGAFIYGYKTEPLDFANPVSLQDGDINGITFVATPITKLHVVQGDDAYESASPSPGYFLIVRDGDTSQDLPVRFALGGTAQSGLDYDSLGQLVTNITYTTNAGVITTNTMVSTNSAAGGIVIPAGEDFTIVAVNPIDNDLSDGTRSVRLSLMLASNDLRTFTYLTNIVTTNNGPPITNTLFVTVTNVVSIPGWDLIETGSGNQLTWFQTYPTYVLATPAEATIQIWDDEPPVPPVVSVFALDSLATETANDCGAVTFVRVGPFDQDLTVQYTVGGSASNGIDYVALPGTITIPAGQQSISLPIIAIDDLFVEGNEDVTITVADDPAGSYTADSTSATVYIVDDDLPLLSVYAPDSLAARGGNNGRITVVRAGDLSSDLVVSYLVSGTAVAGVDYATLSGTVTIPADRISADIAVKALPNSPSIGPRTVTIVLSDSESYNIDTLNKATVTIQDSSLPVVTLAVTSAAAGEGGGQGVFTVTRTGSTNDALNVRFAVGGSALELSDYAAIGTNIVIPAGATTATITITPIEDRFRELGDVSGADNVIIQLLPSPQYNLGSSTSGTVTIGDNDGTDLPVVSFMLKSSSGREDSHDALIPVRISANPATNKLPVIVAYRVTGGTAVQDVNYSFSGTGRLDFVHFTAPSPPDPFHSSEDGIDIIDIPILDDLVAGGDKTFTLTLFNFSGYTTNVSYVTNGMNVFSNVVISPIATNCYIGENRTHTFTILDIGVTTVNIEPLVPFAFEEGAQPGYFRIWRDGSTNKSLTVNLAVSGTASSGSDFVPLPASVTIPAGTNAVIIPVVPHDDPEEEYAESVIVRLIPGSGFSVGDQEATIIIVDNDGTIQFSKANYEVDEGAGDAVIDVVRTGNTNRAATVDYQILDGTATYGLDYRPAQTSGTLAFAPGENLQQIRIPIIDDTLVEPQETINLVLTNATGGLPLGGQRVATLFINDNDISFQFVTNVFQVNENGANAVINVERVGQTNDAASVVLSTIQGTAQADVDFAATNVTLSFDPGETNKTYLLPIIDDELFEGDEILTLLLTQPSPNAAVGPTFLATLVIVDDECAVGFESLNFSTNEYAGVATVVVRRTGGTVNPVSVNYMTVDGTANSTDPNNLDYIAQSGTLNFNGDQLTVSSNGLGQLFFQPGETVKIITIPIVDDALGEGNETFHVLLSDLAGPASGALLGATIYGPVTNATVTIIDDETPGQVDFGFNSGLGPNDTVRAVALQPDGAIVFGGDFTRVNGIDYNRVARLHPNGNLDTSFNPGTGTDGSVWAVASQPDRKVLVGGFFANVDGTNRANLARLNANGTLDLSFDTGTGPNTTVRAIVVQPDGKILVGGEFATFNGQTRTFLARLAASGTNDPTFAAILGGPVYSIALQGDGKIVVGGAFTSVGGANRRFVARLNSNGSIDSQFDTGTGPNNPVSAVAIDDSGKVVLGGLFTTVNGAPRRYIARLNSNGSVDAGFDTGFGANANVNAVAVQPGGKVVIGGDFTLLDGFQLNRFARLRPDGLVDVSFNIGTGADATVNALLVQPDTAVVIGGSFTNVAGLTRNRIARIHGDDKYTPTSVQFDNSSYLVTEDAGSATIRVIRTGNTNVSFTATFLTTDGTATVDQDYVTNQTVLSFGAGETEKLVTIGILNDSNLELDETVLLLLTNVPTYIDVGRGSATLVIQDDETSVQFSSADYITTENSNAVLRIVRSGKLDSELDVTYFTIPGTALEVKDYLAVSNRITFAPFQSTQDIVITIVDDSRKEFTESFQVRLADPSGGTQLGNNSTATVTILDDDLGPGSIDRSFTPGAGLNGFVKAAAMQPDGSMLIGGSFTQADGVARNHIARLGINGAVDLSFDPGQGANALVTSIAVQSGGNIAIGGAFTQVNGTNRNRTAQLLANGQLDSLLSLSNGINAAVHTILPTSQGRMLIGGAFTIPVRGIGRLRNDGTPDTSFFPGLGANGNVYTLVQQPDGRLIVGGDFSTFNNAPRSRVARLQSDGTVDNSFVTGTIATGAVQCVVVQADGKIVIGGDFIRVNGVDRGHVARLNNDGTLDNAFANGLGANGIVYSLSLQLDGKIIVGGGFTSVSGTNRSGVARLNTDGSLDLTFDAGTGTDGPVYVTALTADEHVVIGGDFTVVNGVARRGIARLNPDDPIDLQFLPGSALANGAFQMLISATPGHPYALEASSDLASWTILRTNVAVGTTLSFTDTNAASFNKRFYRVRQVVP